MSERWRTFWLLILGSALFQAALVGVQSIPPYVDVMLMALLTLPFGLPFLVREAGWRRTNWWFVAYFLLLVPLTHEIAWYVAILIFWDLHQGGLVTGAAAGFLAGCLCLAPFAWARLRAPGAPAILLIPAGIVLLTLLGALGVANQDGPAGPFALFVPWQVAFAFFLSRLLRASPPRRLPGRGEDGIGPASDPAREGLPT
jgi:hypothetical protein